MAALPQVEFAKVERVRVPSGLETPIIPHDDTLAFSEDVDCDQIIETIKRIIPCPLNAVWDGIVLTENQRVSAYLLFKSGYTMDSVAELIKTSKVTAIQAAIEIKMREADSTLMATIIKHIEEKLMTGPRGQIILFPGQSVPEEETISSDDNIDDELPPEFPGEAKRPEKSVAEVARELMATPAYQNWLKRVSGYAVTQILRVNRPAPPPAVAPAPSKERDAWIALLHEACTVYVDWHGIEVGFVPDFAAAVPLSPEKLAEFMKDERIVLLAGRHNGGKMDKHLVLTESAEEAALLRARAN